MTEKIDLDYDSLVGLIYEGSLEDRPWQSFLPRLREAMDAHAVSLVLRPPAAGDKGVILNCRRGADSASVDSLADPNDWEAISYREQFFALDPFVNLPPGKVVTQQELVPDQELLNSAYYRDYLEPIGVFHILGVDTVEPNGLIARLRIARQRYEEAFTEQHKQLCEKLLPHLRRAIQIHARLNRTESERDVYAGAVEQLSVATIILDAEGRVLHTNSVAAGILAMKDGIAVLEQELQLGNRAANERLQQLLSTAIGAQRAGETSMARALRVRRPSGLPDLGLVLRPIPAAEWAEGQSSPCVVVFISDPRGQENASQQMLAELFELTPAEANLAIKLARGLSLAAVSAEQNISQHTARAQLKSIFAKTGATRQAELVRLVLKSVASLG
ncbi:MAG: helix-turn-helix transcriptional regulator [Gammaproteobacteria bacterium]|nr:helix-turn-helix transcriptional regulator [Gammaproteobacteria bacterium]